MFNIGFLEIFFILAICLVFFGPKRFPEIAKKLTRFFYRLKQETASIEKEFLEVKKAADIDQELSSKEGKQQG